MAILPQCPLWINDTTFKDLIDDLKSELSSNFEQVIVGMMTPTVLYDVQELRRAMKGAGTDEGCLIEILASRTPEEIRRINQTYQQQYGRSLEEDICSDTSFMFQRVLVSLAAGGRDEGNYLDDALVKQDAQDLYEAGEKKWGTDEVKFLSILCSRNRNHLLHVFDEYKRISQKDIEQSIKSETSGSFEDALLAIVRCMRNKPAYFAERLYKSMKGLGTDDDTLIRVMVSRAEIDMLDIRANFKRLYGKSLYSFIKSSIELRGSDAGEDAAHGFCYCPGGRKRKRSSGAFCYCHPDSETDEDEDEGDEQQRLLNTPRRKKLKSTSKYIYQTLFLNGENSDIKICALGEEWSLHKIYLCQSGYFSSMFSGSWKESSMNIIELEIPDQNIDIEALQVAFGSLYRDDVLIKPSRVVAILAAACMLQLDGLIQQCGETMKETINVKTVCGYYTSAGTYGLDSVKKKCLEWLLNNLMTHQSVELFKELSSSWELHLFDGQIRFPLVSCAHLISRAVFLMDQLLCITNWKVDAEVACDVYCTVYFEGTTFLETEQGKPFAPVFRHLRLQYIISDLASARIIEQDSLVPSEWLSSVYKQQWLAMLRAEQDSEVGPQEINKEELEGNSMRCGRKLAKDGEYCWRWTGFNFGFDLLVTYTNRYIIFKRNTLNQPCSGSVSLQPRRSIAFRSSRRHLGPSWVTEGSHLTCTSVTHKATSTGSEDEDQASLLVYLLKEDLEGKTEEEIEMMKLMGFASFDSTKGKKVDGSVNAYAINVSQKRKYRYAWPLCRVCT
ncbi:Germ cell-less protein-like 1 [Cricetulus griseus]|uniref:Annexin n=1 Tax=Cricetulus griseus TaxID=10029 RepID=G3HXL6_CRIGR|nr:Germ cell-less protein-like 1 [Cricetulus griseus]